MIRIKDLHCMAVLGLGMEALDKAPNKAPHEGQPIPAGANGYRHTEV